MTTHGTRGAARRAAAATAAAAAAAPPPPAAGRRRQAAAATVPAAPLPPAPQQQAPLMPHPLPIGFALSPYTAIQGLLDYSTSDGRKYYERATEKLNEDKFNCESDDLRSFLEDFHRRAQEFGWATGITNIPQPTLPNAPPTYINLITNYGELSMDDILQFEYTYLHLPLRAAQDSAMMYHCLMNSLSKEAKDVITAWKEEYHVNGIPSGNLLLRVMIRESYVDTQATATAIRLKLSNLDSYIASVDHNVNKFNSFVKQQLAALAAHGQTTNDLLTNLFKGYSACSDPVFRRYIEQKKESYEEGSRITANQLMQWAKTKYNLIVEAGLWNSPTTEQQQIYALKAEVESLKKSKPTNRRNRNGNPNGPKKASKEKPSWMFQEPAKGELYKARTWLNFPWYWCGAKTNGKCEQYRRHRGKDCTLKTRQEPTKRQPDQQQQSTSRPTKLLKIKEEPKPHKSNKQLKLTSALAKAATVVDDDANSDTS